ncbi:LysR family transcriptional regulator [Alcaligenes sp. RM2]|uniref:LysR family transcriptional regulator n=1 Tax=Alcaligenes TaxID=507 RepID=UPI00202EDF6F|nr:MULTISPECIES: LysR family transcriptional regulator [Alcaligenes]URW82929.1 LysR family transcriptional regulator [Alcaligenes sp. DN25]UTM03217.1 LysR family transcriptional regulator [Alcaligenes sp. NLF5-7]WEA67758.1 LysR family transcriptional regulator [Alcaligenes faecalis]
MIPSERLKGIAAFVASVDAGSFTAAGQALNLSGSAISKSVARLEERLGARLLERSTRRLALTDAGTAFYHSCVRVLSELEQAEQSLASRHEAPLGKLRIDAPATFGRLKVWPLLLQLRQQYPRLDMHLSLSDRFVDVVEEGIDLAVRIGGPAPDSPHLGYQHLGRERLIFCASPTYLNRAGVPSALADLQHHEKVLYGRADGSTGPWRILHDNGLTERQEQRGGLVVGNAEAQIMAVLAHGGIAQLATWLVQEHLDNGELIAVLPQLDTEGLPLSLIWPIGRQLLPKVSASLAHLSQGLCIA